MRARDWLRALWLGGTALLLLQACATLSGGHIPPSAFEFHRIVAKEGAAPGGWKVAQVNILLARASQRRPLYAWCDVEIGVPVENWQRAVPDVVAQEKSAEAADRASQIVLRENETVSVLACQRFRQEMTRMLSASFKGVRVTKFITPGIEPKTFPDE